MSKLKRKRKRKFQRKTKTKTKMIPRSKAKKTLVSPPSYICEILILVMWPFSETSADQIYQNHSNNGWVIVIYPFSKWRTSAIFSFRNLLFYSSILCLRAILLRPYKFRAKRTTWRWDNSRKMIFKMATVRNLVPVKFWFFWSLDHFLNQLSKFHQSQTNWGWYNSRWSFQCKIGFANAPYHVIWW